MAASLSRFLTLFIFLTIPLCAASEIPDRSELDRALDRLYNHDFAASRRLASDYTAGHATDELGFAMQSAIELYAELSRMNVLDHNLLADQEKVKQTAAIKTDPSVRERLRLAANRSIKLSEAALQKDPKNRDALLAVCLANGVLRDYEALAEKKFRQSLVHAKQSQAYAMRLLAVDPKAYDAYLTTGFTEYLVGALPFFVKWFVKIDGVQGDKERGMRNLQLVATEGHYFKPFAQLLLAQFYLREKQPRKSELLLAELCRNYPENPVFREELTRIAALVHDGSTLSAN